jgi:DNA-binding LacI/PurR family transcriptional regulator
MTVKLRDVALQAGVSVSTVSNVLNGYTKSGIRQETFEKVRRIAKEMGYRPNALARSLKVQRTNTIGFYTASTTSTSTSTATSAAKAPTRSECASPTAASTALSFTPHKTIQP